jgi:hypothetical protein
MDYDVHEMAYLLLRKDLHSKFHRGNVAYLRVRVPRSILNADLIQHLQISDAKLCALL